MTIHASGDGTGIDRDSQFGRRADPAPGGAVGWRGDPDGIGGRAGGGTG
ncbi:MAG: hypothetical protein V5A46_07955 [Haloferacaceae archaeon]